MIRVASIYIVFKMIKKTKIKKSVSLSQFKKRTNTLKKREENPQLK